MPRIFISTGPDARPSLHVRSPSAMFSLLAIGGLTHASANVLAQGSCGDAVESFPLACIPTTVRYGSFADTEVKMPSVLIAALQNITDGHPLLHDECAIRDPDVPEFGCENTPFGQDALWIGASRHSFGECVGNLSDYVFATPSITYKNYAKKAICFTFIQYLAGIDMGWLGCHMHSYKAFLQECLDHADLANLNFHSHSVRMLCMLAEEMGVEMPPFQYRDCMSQIYDDSLRLRQRWYAKAFLPVQVFGPPPLEWWHGFGPGGYGVTDPMYGWTWLVLDNNIDYFFGYDLAWRNFAGADRDPEPCSQTCHSTHRVVNGNVCDWHAWNLRQERASSDGWQDTPQVLGYGCRSQELWYNCGCDQCDSWRHLCGCYLFDSTSVTSLDLADHIANSSAVSHTLLRSSDANAEVEEMCDEGRKLLHGARCTPRCISGSVAHRATAFECYDGELVASGYPDVKLLDVFTCYHDSPGNVTVGQIEFEDGDFADGLITGHMIFSLASVPPGELRMVSKLSLYWSTDDTLISTTPFATVLFPIDGPIPPQLVYFLDGEIVPSAATHILTYYSNDFGDSNHSWPAFHVEQSAHAAQVLFHVATAWTAGASSRVVTTTNNLRPHGRLFMVPSESSCEGGGRDMVIGQQVRSREEGDALVQDWDLRPPNSSEYSLCYETCKSTGSTGFARHCHYEKYPQDMSVSVCHGCEEPCSCCFAADAGACEPPLLRERRVEETDYDIGETVASSMDVSSDGSMAFLVTSSAQVIALNTSSGTATVFGMENGSCEYSCNDDTSESCRYHSVHPFSSPEQPLTREYSHVLPSPSESAHHCDSLGVHAHNTQFLRLSSVRVSRSQTFLLIVDYGAHRVRKISFGGHPLDTSHWVVTTVAGSGRATLRMGLSPQYSLFAKMLRQNNVFLSRSLTALPVDVLQGNFQGDGGPADRANLNLPWDVALAHGDDDVFFIADRMNHRIRQVSRGVITTVFGNGLDLPACMGTSETRPEILCEPTGVEIVPGDGRLVVAERLSMRIRIIDITSRSSQLLATVPGDRQFFAPTLLRLSSPREVMYLSECVGGPSCRVMSRVALPISSSQGRLLAEAVGETLHLFSRFGENVTSKILTEVVAFAADMQGTILAAARGQGTSLYRVGAHQAVACGSDMVEDDISNVCRCADGLFNRSSDLAHLDCAVCPVGHYCAGNFRFVCPGAAPTTYRKVERFDGMDCSGVPSNLSFASGSLCVGVTGASSISSCSCNHGRFHVPNSTECITCSDGLLCPASWLPHSRSLSATVFLDNGYWADAIGGQYSVYECRHLSVCWWTTYAQLWKSASLRTCLGSAPFRAGGVKHCAAQAGSVGGRPNKCAGNRAGFRCSGCERNYLRNSEHQCIACSGAIKPLDMIVSIVCPLAAILVFYHFLNRNPHSGKFMASSGLVYGCASLIEFALESSMMGDLKILPSIPLVENFLSMIPNPTSLLKPFRCAFGDADAAAYPVDLMLPVLIAMMLIVLWAFFFLTAPCRKRWIPEELPEFQGAFGRRLVVAVRMFRTYAMVRDKMFNTYMFILCFLYVRLNKLSLSIFIAQDAVPLTGQYPLGVKDQSGVQPVLKFYPYIKFRSSEWWGWLPAGATAFAMTIVFYIFHVVVVILSTREFVMKASFRAKFKYFFGKYREDRYWWQLVVMARQLILNFIGVIETIASLAGNSNYGSIKYIQLRVSFVLYMLYLIAFIFAEPYKNALNSRLDMALSSYHILRLVLIPADSFLDHELGILWMLSEVALCLFFAGACGFTMVALGRMKRFFMVQPSSLEPDQLAVECLFLGSSVGKMEMDILTKGFKSVSAPERGHLQKGCAIFGFCVAGAMDRSVRNSLNGLLPARNSSRTSLSTSEDLPDPLSFTLEDDACDSAAMPSYRSEDSQTSKSCLRNSVLLGRTELQHLGGAVSGESKE